MGLTWKLAFNRLLVFFVLDLVLGLIVVVFVILLQEGILAFLGGLRSLVPFVAGLVFEFLVEFLFSGLQIKGTHGFDLTVFADTTPSGVGVILVIVVVQKLQSVELVVVPTNVCLIQ